MAAENEKGRRIMDDIENLVEDVNKVVRVVVTRGSDAAESVGENVRGTIKDTLRGVRSARDSVVMIRVDKESLTRLDELVESSIAGSRSEAAAFLITAGIKSRRDLFEKISEKIEQIRKAKEELAQLLEDEEGDGPRGASDQPS